MERKIGFPAYFTHWPELAYPEGNSDNAGMSIMSSIGAVLETKPKSALNQKQGVKKRKRFGCARSRPRVDTLAE